MILTMAVTIAVMTIIQKPDFFQCRSFEYPVMIRIPETKATICNIINVVEWRPEMNQGQRLELTCRDSLNFHIHQQNL